MIGFKISINDEVFKIGLSEGVTTVNFTRVLLDDRDELDLNAGGLDVQMNRHLKWLKKELKIGDRILIEIQDFVDASEPIELVEEEPDEIILQSKLRYYNNLKKELEEKGLI